MTDYLVIRTVKSEKYRFFSCCIPKDLRNHFKNRSKFYLSINSATNRQARLICHNLYRITIELFAEIRMGMKSLTVEEIKEILRVEIRKQILWAHHVKEGTSEHDIHNRMNSLSSVSDQEQSLMKKIANDEKSYDKELDGKLTSILESLEIDSSTKSVAYKQLRRHFKSLYLLRYDWARSLIKKSGREDDDFRREAGEMLSLDLYTDFVKERRAIRDERINEEEIIQSQRESAEQIDDSSSLESTPLSEVIDSYLDEKSYDNEKTADKIEHALRMLVEDFGDIAINRINPARVSLFKQHLRYLPVEEIR